MCTLKGFLSGSGGKEPTCNAGDTGDAGLTPESRRSPGEGNGSPLQLFLPGESHGQSPKDQKESDIAKQAHT